MPLATGRSTRLSFHSKLEEGPSTLNSFDYEPDLLYSTKLKLGSTREGAYGNLSSGVELGGYCRISNYVVYAYKEYIIYRQGIYEACSSRYRETKSAVPDTPGIKEVHTEKD